MFPLWKCKLHEERKSLLFLTLSPQSLFPDDQSEWPSYRTNSLMTEQHATNVIQMTEISLRFADKADMQFQIPCYTTLFQPTNLSRSITSSFSFIWKVVAWVLFLIRALFIQLFCLGKVRGRDYLIQVLPLPFLANILFLEFIYSWFLF